MRIGLITDRYLPEARAAAYHTSLLAEGWARKGHQVTVFTRRPSNFVPCGQESEGRPEDVEVHRVPCLTASLSFWARLADQAAVMIGLFFALMGAPRPDAYYVLSPPLLLTLPVALASLIRRVPFLLNLHDLYPQAAIDLGVLHNRFLIGAARMLESFVYKRAARILVAAPASVRVLRERNSVPNEKLGLLWNFVETVDAASADGARFRGALGEDPRFLILYAGQMGPAQDIDLMLDTAARAATEYPEWRFVLIGDGPRAAEWRARAAKLPNVRMLPFLGTRDYFDALAGCDVALACLSSIYLAPAIPGKIQTIMASGKPVLASAPPENDTHRLLRETSAGFSVAAGDLAAFYLGLQTLHCSRELRQRMGQKGAQYARSHFSAAGAVDQTVRVLSAVVADVSRSAAPCTLSSS